MAEKNTAVAGDDTGVPADMVEGGEGTKTNGQDGDVEGFAKRLGWKPQEEFKPRKPGQEWMPADSFVERVKKETPLLRERLRFQDDVISKQEKQLKETNSRLDELGQVTRELLTKTSTAEQRGFARAREEIEAQMERAVSEADTDGFRRAKRELEELDKAKPAPAVAKKDKEETKPVDGAPQVSPVATQWIKDNDWFEKDAKLKAFATTWEGVVARENPGWSLSQILEEVKAETERRFPEKFENQARKAPAAVANPSAPANQRKGKDKTVADLPADAKETLAKLKRLIKGYSDKDYLKDYKWD